MDLESAHGGASWHPLTSLIVYESQARFRDLFFLPIVELPERGAYSTLLHEITHLWCARTTRLGYYLARTSAELLKSWSDGGQNELQLSKSQSTVLAAYTPLLEGLAMFAQLDYTTDRVDDPLATPLSLIVSMFALSLQNYHKSRSEILDYIRNDARYVDEHHVNSIAEVLFLNTSAMTKNYYLNGYLYVKALQSNYRSQCSEMSNPRVFLPIVMRLMCDHPLLDEACNDSLSLNSVLTTMHKSLTTWGCAELDRFAKWATESPDFQQRIDNWDPYVVSDVPVYHDSSTVKKYFPVDDNGNAISPADESLIDWVLVARCSASVFVLSWHTGRLGSFPLQDMLPMVPGLQWTIMSLAEDAEITMANYMTLTSGVPGVAVWEDGELKGACPLGGVSHDEDDEYLVRTGLKVSPEHRREFARALGRHSELDLQIQRSGRWLLSQLVSDHDALESIDKYRLFRQLRPNTRCFRNWCQHRPFESEDLPSSVVRAAVENAFTFPGFSGLIGKPQALDLFPKFTTMKTA